MKQNTMEWIYRGATALAALALAAIGIGDLLHAPEIVQGLTSLGYPPYFATILGVWKLLGVAAIVTPGHVRLKEWAYAGFFFVLTGAATSHAVSHDPAAKVIVPVTLLVLVMTSWSAAPRAQRVRASH
jgi:uncharacterized membrane protein YphA (DoxX/SURF4 family)